MHNLLEIIILKNVLKKKLTDNFIYFYYIIGINNNDLNTQQSWTQKKR
jgi:hypothetical protein